MRHLLPIPAFLMVLSAVAAGCSGDDTNAQSPENDAGHTPDTYVPEKDAGQDVGEPDANDSGAIPDAAPSKIVLFPFKPAGCDYSLAGVAPSNPEVTLDSDEASAKPIIRSLHLTYSGDVDHVSTPSSSIVVQWATDDATLESKVYIQEASAIADAGTPDGGDGGVGGCNVDLKAAQVFSGYSFPYVTDRGYATREHEVHVCGLKPNTKYCYVAGGKTAQSKGYSFSTAPADKNATVKVLVVGDSRRSPWRWPTVAAAASAFAPDVMLFSGDLVNAGAQQDLWDEWFGNEVGTVALSSQDKALAAKLRDFMATTPGLYAHGNHEGFAEPYFDQFALPNNGGDKNAQELFYQVVFGPVRLIALNLSEGGGPDFAGNATKAKRWSDQLDWLKTTLENANKTGERDKVPFIVTSHHYPIESASASHPDDGDYAREKWGPWFETYKVNMDVAGHNHHYESFKPLTKIGLPKKLDGSFDIVASGEGARGKVVDPGQGTVLLTYGGAGAGSYDRLPIAADDPYYSGVGAIAWRDQSNISLHLPDIGATKTIGSSMPSANGFVGFGILTVNGSGANPSMTWEAYKVTNDTGTSWSLVETFDLPNWQ